MQSRSPLWLAALVFAGSSSVALAQDLAPDSVLATVNGEDITAGQVMLLRQQLPQHLQAVPDDQLYPALVEQAVQQALLAGEAGDPDPLTQAMLDTQVRGVLAEAAAQNVVAGAVTPDTLQAAYDEAYAAADPETEFNASHILLATEEEAAEVKSLLDDGGDFAQLARERSTGPSGPNGGELGWFSAGMMVPEFEAAVMELEPGQVSVPVQTQFGWHVVKLAETRLKAAPPLEEVEGELATAIQQAALEEHLGDLAAAAEISRVPEAEVDPAFLSDPAFFDSQN